MDCKEFERLIPDFIGNKLDYPSLKRFNRHMEHCTECQEGIQRLEDGGAFDLQKELDQRLDEARRRLRLHDGFMRMGAVLEIIAVCLLAGIILWILL